MLRSTGRVLAVGVAAGFLAGVLAGCPPVPRGFGSPDPNMRLRAILEVEEGEREKIPELIDQLASADPAARLLAIRQLERITGETRGYDHAGPAWERTRAINAWRDWWSASADAGVDGGGGSDAGGGTLAD